MRRKIFMKHVQSEMTSEEIKLAKGSRNEYINLKKQGRTGIFMSEDLTVQSMITYVSRIHS